jgi:hypothetical protein
MKNILILGDAKEQVIALKNAKEMGYRTLLSDKVVEILNNKDKFSKFLKKMGLILML